MIIIRLIKRRKKQLFTLWEFNGSSFEQTWIPFTQGCIVPNLVEIGKVVLEKNIFKFRQCNFAIWLFSPLGNGMELQLYNLESFSPKDALFKDWLKLAQWFFKFHQCLYASLSSALEIGPAFHLNKFEFASPKDALCQVWLKLAYWFFRKWFLNFVNEFSQCHYHLCGSSFEHSFSHRCFVASLLEVSLFILEKTMFKFSKWFLQFQNLSLSCKEHGHFLIKYNPLHLNLGCFVPKFVETDPVVLENKMKMRKVYRKMERKTNGQQAIRKLINHSAPVIKKTSVAVQVQVNHEHKLIRIYLSPNFKLVNVL